MRKSCWECVRQIEDIQEAAMAGFLNSMFLRHLARYSSRSWLSWRSAVNAAITVTSVWLTSAVVFLITAIVGCLKLLLPTHFPHFGGPEWLYPALTFPLFIICDRYVVRLASCASDGISEDALQTYNTPSQRACRWFQALSFVPLLLSTVGIWAWVAG